jgi:hypothetical protein
MTVTTFRQKTVKKERVGVPQVTLVQQFSYEGFSVSSLLRKFTEEKTEALNISLTGVTFSMPQNYTSILDYHHRNLASGVVTFSILLFLKTS